MKISSLPLFLTWVFWSISMYDGFSQKFYAGIGGGYGFSMASQNLTSKIDNGIAQTSNTLVKGSLGRGTLLSGYIGYKKNEHIGLELGISYLIGHKYKGRYTKEMDFEQTTTMSSNMFRLAPGIRFSMGENRIKPYIKLGLIARVFGRIIIKESHYNIQNNTTTEIEWKYSNGLSIGLTASLGCIRKINEKLSFFGELGMINQSWGPKKGKVSKYTVNGVDMLANLNPYQKHTDYSNNYSETNNNPSVSHQPRKQLKQYFPFSSVGINLGINFTFGKSIK